MQKSFMMKVEEYVRSILETRTPPWNHYHDLAHTKEVVKSSVEIGISEKLSDDDLEIIKIAAWFHDVGYIEKTEGHEETSAMYASNFLSEENYPAEKIVTVVGCILATKIPQKPKNKLEEIICDADLSHLGKKIFFERNNKFRVEYENYPERKLTEYEWLIKTIDFITSHHFFTDYAVQNFSEQKKENLHVLQEQVQQIINHPK